MRELNTKEFDLYLASASPRRKELLESVGVRVKTCPADIDESALLSELPQDYVQRLALQKAQASRAALLESTGLQDKDIAQPFLGSDTIVVCQGELFGKPKDKEDAMRMWQAMAGGKHQVLTAVSVISTDKEITVLSESDVYFSQVSDASMQAYWQTGEPQDKAGAYGIQGFAAAWVESIQGSYTGIMGLPLYETNQALKQFGLAWLD